MSLAEKLIKDFEQLSEDKKKEVIDFVEFLKIKERRWGRIVIRFLRRHQPCHV